MEFDIGLMPLTDDEWSKGKCGLKLLQYMAMSVPAVASPVGVNCDIIEDGEDGFLAQSEREWEEKLSRLIDDRGLREEMGRKARMKVEKRYSVRAIFPQFLGALMKVRE